MKRIILIFILFAFTTGTAWSSAAQPKSIRIYPELEGHWFLDGKMAFGCEVTYSNGGKRRTAGYLNGNLPWRDLIVQCEQGWVHGDELLVDLFKVRQNNNTLVVRARHRENPKVETSFEIKVPPLTSIGVLLPENTHPFYGKSIVPFISLEWANGVRYTYKASDSRALIARDSVEMYFNSSRMYNGIIQLPVFNIEEPHTFSISVVWAGKPWLHDVQSFAYRGKDHRVWNFTSASGADARRQAKAPTGMDGAEGFYGLPGADAEEVHVRLSMNADKTRMAATASNGIKTFTRIFKPEEFSLEIVARGGDGGDGGRGGEGGSAPFDDPYKAGVGGNGGRG
ncbi:MAG: hypothetical protein ACKOSR_01475, partial [Flavobacteriales bacterium]